jgi:urease accessory protein
MAWDATLELAYARQGVRTVPVTRRHTGPLRVQKHFHPEANGLCQHVLIHPPAGLVGGDRVMLDVAVGVDAAVQLTTPGAAKVYRSDEAAAVQTLAARVEGGGWLEWLPQETIVFDGARARLECGFELAPRARLLAWDILVLGAATPFVDGDVRQAFEVRVAGVPVLSDSVRYDAALCASPLGLGGARVSAVLVAFGDVAAGLVEACRALESSGPDGRARVTQFGDQPMLVGRWLGSSVERARRWLVSLWRLLRPSLGGGEALLPRIWST